MLLQRLPYLFVYFVAFLVSLAIVYSVWRNRSGKGNIAFAWGAILEIAWLVGYLFEINSSSLQAKIFWDNFQNIGAFLIPVTFIVFALEFTEAKLNSRRVGVLLSILPAVLLIVILSEPFVMSERLTELVRTDTRIIPGVPFDELAYGFGRLTFIGYLYTVILSFVYLGILIANFFKKNGINRSQLALVLLGTLIPILGSVPVVLGADWKFANQRDVSPLAFALGNAVIALGIFRFRLFNVIPIARETLFENIEDVLIVLNREDIVVDVNPSARAAFGLEAKQIIGNHIQTILPELYAQYANILETRAEISTAENHYDLKITPIYDRTGTLFGRLINAHDITLQKRAEQNLKKTNDQIRQRARQFQAIAQVASSATSVQELEKALAHIVETISLQLGHYHVAIFLLDATREFAILSAANSIPGQEMLAQSYRFRLGDNNLVGIVASRSRSQIDTNPAHPNLPDTRSEVALPIKINGQVVGVLDVQSSTADAFAQDDIEILEILVNQVGTTIQNARLYEQNIQALNDAEDAYQRLAGTTWANTLQKLDVKGYSYDGVSSRAVGQKNTNKTDTSLSVPVQVRGQVIGNLRLNALDQNRAWTEDEIAITRAVAERAALALEGARLLDEAQKRASRELFLSEIAAKLGSSFQLDSILRDTVEELGQTLKGSTVSFQLINPSAPINVESQDGSSGRRKKSE